ncbi:hypothetical protein GCM10023185_28560 [Hymenobacter saemangeumensis]|uniref:EfeO-type cupredoxin-like domain-containing protein n=1 Tax=Hymenobacter saemangeumensis TaxID=1084522 RepID=A0ABP8IKH9_9BACT
MKTTLRFTHFPHPLASFIRPALGSLALLLGFSQPQAQAQTWMVDSTPYIRLGIEASAALSSPKPTTFVVRHEKTGTEYELSQEAAAGTRELTVLFPTPANGEMTYFKTSAGKTPNWAPGKYTWSCKVGSEVAGYGAFVMPECKIDQIIQKAQ